MLKTNKQTEETYILSHFPTRAESQTIATLQQRAHPHRLCPLETDPYGTASHSSSTGGGMT